MENNKAHPPTVRDAPWRRAGDVMVQAVRGIHAFIISWSGHREKARAIARAIEPLVARLTVVYSNAEEATENGPGEWCQVPNAYFYGRKFRECLALFRGDIMLQVTADAASDDWPSVIASVERCYAEIPDLEVWAPGIDACWHTDKRVIAGDACLPGVEIVYRTDAVVWAVTARTVERFKALDYECNNLGWGLDLVAAAYAFSGRRLVVRDTGVVVGHPPGSGYDHHEAARQEAVFLRQLDRHERLQCQLIRRWSETADVPPPIGIPERLLSRLRILGGRAKRSLRRRAPWIPGATRPALRPD